MPVVPAALVAFRCRNCGRLHEAGHAGEHEVPHACRVCGAGVVFRHQELAADLQAALETGDKDKAKRLAAEVGRCDPASKRLVSDNWEVLAEATPERLTELGLTPEQVEAHEPWPKAASEDHPARHIAVTAHDGPASADNA